ncbi:class I SAM-dependent methyltransferase [Skermania sp. ID1734]|nr:class I SAM-dependent methyltransferase [Skermania sp. ID1734]TSE01968.1 class I SAM-dependent methyltransferase [Skermania sp. ID1734]
MADWDGASYGDISDLQRAMAAESLESVDLRGDERVLDIGCGDGFVTRRIADRLPRGSVIGVDPSPRMVDAALGRATQNLSFELGDVTTLRFLDEFDLVVSFNALHWVHDQAAAYRRIAAALRPTGRAIVRFVCGGPRRSIEQVSMAVTQDPRWAAAFDGFEAPFVHVMPDEFEKIVTGAGLIVASKSVTDIHWDFGSRKAFQYWCTVGSSDWTARLPAADVDAFAAAVLDQYSEITGSETEFRFLQLRAELRPAPR